MGAMDAVPPRSTRPSSPTLSRLLPLADRVEVLTRSTGRAFVARDAELARALLAEGGEHDRLGSALDDVWTDVLSDSTRTPANVPPSANLVHSLQTILELVGTICDHVVSLAGGEPALHATAIEKLAEMVSDLLRDAVGALRRNDAVYAAEVLRAAIGVDAVFAQTYLDLMQVVRQNEGRLEIAQHLHGVTRAFERIGDTAGEIAGRVQPLPA